MSKEDRKARLTSSSSGSWGSSSVDFVRLSRELYWLSEEEAERNNGNFSQYTLPVIPMLFSALRALMIECCGGMYGGKNQELLGQLATAFHDLNFLKKNYAISERLYEDLKLLYEVRNEIIHPAHMPSGTPDETPEYLRTLRERGLLEIGPLIGQLQSHKLLSWAMEVVSEALSILIEQGVPNETMRQGYLSSISMYKQRNL